MDLTVTLFIIILTSGISLLTMQKPQVLHKLMMNPYMIVHRNQYYRLITSGFIHKDFTHLLFNMFSFYFFGSQLEYIFQYIFGDLGIVYFILLYILAIIISDLPTLFKYRDSYNYNSLGASGAVSAVIFACILFQPLQDICLYAVLCFPGFILGIIYLVYSYYSAKKSRDGINHDAHLYGALFGILFCLVLYPNSIFIFIEQISEWKLF